MFIANPLNREYFQLSNEKHSTDTKVVSFPSLECWNVLKHQFLYLLKSQILHKPCPDVLYKSKRMISNHYSPEQLLRVIYLKEINQKHSSVPGFEDHIRKAGA